MNYIEERRALRRSPTRDLWEKEIARLLSGQRALDLMRFGGVSEYILTTLAESDDPAVAEASFQQALRETIQGLKFAAIQRVSYAACVLDLLSAFTPAAGLPKLLSVVQRGPGYWEVLEDDALYPAPPDLYLKSLATLREYFAAPPIAAATDDAYSLYVDILNASLEMPQYAPFSFLCLWQLGALEPRSAAFVKAVRDNPRVVEAAIAFAFEEPDAPRQDLLLSGLYEASLTLLGSSSTRLHEMIEELGGEIIHERTAKADSYEGLREAAVATTIRSPFGDTFLLSLNWGDNHMAHLLFTDRHSADALRGGLARLRDFPVGFDESAAGTIELPN